MATKMHTFAVQVPDDLAERIVRATEEDEMSVGAFLRRAVRHYLADRSERGHHPRQGVPS